MQSKQMKQNVTVKKMECARIPTDEGTFQLCFYDNNIDNKEHLAMVLGDVEGKEDVLVRIHSECFTGDVLGSQRCDCGPQLQRAMQTIADAGMGVILYLRQEGRGIGLLQKIRAYNLQDQGYDTVDANIILGHQADERDYTIAAKILEDLKIRSIQLLTNNPQKVESLKELGIQVTSRIPHYGVITKDNLAYLQTKVNRMQHLLGLGKSLDLNNPSVSEPTNLSDEIRFRLDDGMKNLKECGRPFITLSYAQTLDGSIALPSGNPLQISGHQSHRLTHEIRSLHDAILVGIGTVLTDNPRLTVRLVEGKNPQPIILDSQLRTPLNSNLIGNPQTLPWIMTSMSADPDRQKKLEKTGAKVFRLHNGKDGYLDLHEIMLLLCGLKIHSLMVEGGTKVITNFLRTRLVDQIIQTVAPTIIGGVRAVERTSLTGETRFPQLINMRHQMLGSDLVIRGDVIWKNISIS